MSATRDKSQKTTFVYSNLYQLYRKGKDAVATAGAPGEAIAPLHAPFSTAQQTHAAPVQGQVLKAQEARSEPLIQPYTPVELLGKRVERPAVLQNAAAIAPRGEPGQAAIESLKKNLKTLNDLHSRLRFMLQELEELVKE